MRKLFFGLIFLFVLLGAVNYMPKANALDQVDVWIGEIADSYIGTAVNDGTYVYVVTKADPNSVVKLDPSTMLETDRWIAPLGIYLYGVVSDNTYLYCYTSNTIIYKIDPTSMTQVGVWYGRLDRYIDGVTVDGSYMYVATEGDYGPEWVEKVNCSTMLIDSKFVSSVPGYNYANTIIYNDGRLYLALGEYPAVIINIDASDMTTYSTWTGAVNEDDPFCLTFLDGYLYVGLYTSPTVVIKIDNSTMTTSDSWVGESYDNWCKGLTNDGVNLYVLPSTSSFANITKIDPATMITSDTWQNVFAVSVGGLSYFDGNLYAGTLTIGCSVIQIDVATFSTMNSWDGSSGENSANDMIRIGTDLYVLTDNYPAHLIKVDSATMETTDIWVAGPTEGSGYGLSTDGTFFYVALYNALPSVIVKIDIATMLEVDRYTTSTASDFWDTYYEDGYIYGLMRDTPTVVKIDVSDMSYVSNVTTTGTYGGSITGGDGTNVYICTSDSPALVHKINFTTMTVSETWTGSLNEDVGTVVIYSGGYVYLAINSIVANYSGVIKIDTSSMLTVDKYTMTTGADSLGMYGTHIFVGEYSGAKIYIIESSTMEQLDGFVSTNPGASIKCFASDGTYVYVGQAVRSATVTKYGSIDYILTSDTDAIGLSYQRKTFNCSGLFWYFYTNGVNMVYRTSADAGVTWTDYTTISLGVADGRDFSVYYDGYYVHYVACNPYILNSLVYRRGVPEFGGAITWSAPEQSVDTLYGTIQHPTVTIDLLNWTPWIGYEDNQLPYVTKSVKDDGTWVTETLFPYLLTNTVGDWGVSVVPLSGDTILAVYATDNAFIVSRYFNATSGTIISENNALDPTNVDIIKNGSFTTTTDWGPDLVIDNAGNAFFGTGIQLEQEIYPYVRVRSIDSFGYDILWNTTTTLGTATYTVIIRFSDTTTQTIDFMLSEADKDSWSTVNLYPYILYNSTNFSKSIDKISFINSSSSEFKLRSVSLNWRTNGVAIEEYVGATPFNPVRNGNFEQPLSIGWMVSGAFRDIPGCTYNNNYGKFSLSMTVGDYAYQNFTAVVPVDNIDGISFAKWFDSTGSINFIVRYNDTTHTDFVIFGGDIFATPWNTQFISVASLEAGKFISSIEFSGSDVLCSIDVVDIEMTTLTEQWADDIVTDGTYLYTCLSTQPTIVLKLNKDTLNIVDLWMGNEFQTNGDSIIYDNGYIYVGMASSTQMIVKIDVTDMSFVDQYLSSSPDVFRCSGLAEDGTYIYSTGYRTPSSNAVVTKIQMSDMTYVSNWTATNPTVFNPGTILYDGTNLYVECDIQPPLVIQINPVTMTEIANWTTASGETMEITESGLYLYVTVWDTNVYKVLKSTMVTDSSWSGANDFCDAITNDGTYLYVVDDNVPSHISKIYMSNMTTNVVYELPYLDVYKLLSFDNQIYAPSFSIPAIIVRLPNILDVSDEVIRSVPPEVFTATAIKSFDAFTIAPMTYYDFMVYFSVANETLACNYYYNNAGGIYANQFVLQSTSPVDLYPVVTINPVTNDMYIFWAGYPETNHIYVRFFDGGTGIWGSRTDIKTVLPLYNNMINSFEQSHSPVGVSWNEGAVIPLKLGMEDFENPSAFTTTISSLTSVATETTTTTISGIPTTTQTTSKVTSLTSTVHTTYVTTITTTQYMTTDITSETTIKTTSVLLTTTSSAFLTTQNVLSTTTTCSTSLSDLYVIEIEVSITEVKLEENVDNIEIRINTESQDIINSIDEIIGITYTQTTTQTCTTGSNILTSITTSYTTISTMPLISTNELTSITTTITTMCTTTVYSTHVATTLLLSTYYSTFTSSTQIISTDASTTVISTTTTNDATEIIIEITSVTEDVVVTESFDESVYITVESHVSVLSTIEERIGLELTTTTTTSSSTTSTLTSTTIQTTVYCNSYVSPTLYVTSTYVASTTKYFTSSSSIATIRSSTYITSKLTTNAAQSITTTVTIMSCSTTTSTTKTTTCTTDSSTTNTGIIISKIYQVITIEKETNRLISSREFYYSRDVSLTGTVIVTIVEYTNSCTTTCTSGRTTVSATSITSTTSCKSTTEIYLRTSTSFYTVCISNSSNVKTTLTFTNDASSCYSESASRTFWSSLTTLTSTTTNNTTVVTTTTIFNVIKQIEMSSLYYSKDGAKTVIMTDILDLTERLTANQNVTVCVFTTSSQITSITTLTCSTISVTTFNPTFSSSSTTTCTSSSTSVTTSTTTTSTESTMCTSTTCTSSSTSTTLTSTTTTILTSSTSTTTSSTTSITSTTSTSTTAEGITFIEYEIIRFTEIFNEYEIIKDYATQIHDVSLDIYKDITIRKGLELSTSTSCTTSKVTPSIVYTTVVTTTQSVTNTCVTSSEDVTTVITNITLTTTTPTNAQMLTWTVLTTTTSTSSTDTVTTATTSTTSSSIVTSLTTVSISSTLSTITFTTDGTINAVKIIQFVQTVNAVEQLNKKYIVKETEKDIVLIDAQHKVYLPSLAQAFRNMGYEIVSPGGTPMFWNSPWSFPSIVHDIVHSGLNAVLFNSYNNIYQDFTYTTSNDITDFGVWCYIPSTYPLENLFEITTNNGSELIDLSGEAKDVWFYLDLSGYTTLIGNGISTIDFSVSYSPSGAWEVSPIYLDDWTLTYTPSLPPMFTNAISALGLTNQRKTFNATGLTWLFYTDGANLVYTTSSDNMIWEDSIIVKTGVTLGEDFSIWYDGTYVYYSYGFAENINPLPSYLSFRSGTPNADGSITWNHAEEQINVDPVDLGHTGFGAEYSYICVDTLGYVWISYTDNGFINVIKSGNTDGTWGLTSYGYPYEVSPLPFDWKSTVVPLTAGKVLVTYAIDGFVYARYFNSSSSSFNSTNVWNVDMGAWTGSPTYSGGYVYVPSDDGHLFKYDATTGTEIWDFASPEGNVMNTPAVSGGFVYVGENGSPGGSLWCIDATTGVAEWNVVIDDEVQTKPVFANGYVYFGSNDWYVYCFDASTGVGIWSFEAWNQVSGNPVIYDNDLIIGSSSAIYRLDGMTGAQIWNCTDGSIWTNDLYNNIVLEGDYVYTTVPGQATVVKVNAITGALVWDVFVSGVTYGDSPFVSNGAVYVGTQTNMLKCLSTLDGSVIWSSTDLGSDIYNPSVSDGVVYVGSQDNNVYAFVASSGELLGNYVTGGDTWAYPTFSTTYVYVTSKDGIVYAFNKAVVVLPQAGVEVATTNSMYDFETIYSVVAQDDMVHLVYMSDDDTIVYYKYTFSIAGGSFGAETILQTDTGGIVVYPTITIDGSDNLFVYWAGFPSVGHIYGKQYNTTTWSMRVELEADVNLTNNKLTSFYESHSPVGVAWMTLNVPPYTIVLKNLYFPFVINEPVTVSLEITDMDTVNNVYSMYKYYTFVAVVSTPTDPCDVTDVWVTVQQGAGPIIFKIQATTLTTVPQFFIDTGDAVIDLDSANCLWSVVGQQGTATFKVRTEWDFVDDTDLDMYLEAQNIDGDTGIILMQTDYFDVIGTLVATMTTGTPSVALNTPVGITGLVTYPTEVGGLISSGCYPPNAQFVGVALYEDAALIVTDNGIVNGVYDVVFTPGLVLMAHTYHLHLDMAPDFVDGHPANNPTLVITVSNDIPGLWAGILWWLDKIFLFFGVGPSTIAGPYFGVGPTQMIVNWLANMSSFFISSIILMISTVTMLGSMIIGFSIFILQWGISVGLIVMQITGAVVSIFNGTGMVINGITYGVPTGLGNIWNYFNGGSLFAIMPIFIIVWWMMSLDDRVKTTGQNHFAIAIGDIQTAFGLISIMTWFAMTIYSTIFGIVQWVFGLIGGILS